MKAYCRTCKKVTEHRLCNNPVCEICCNECHTIAITFHEPVIVQPSSSGPMGSFPLNPPWQDDAMKSVLDMYDPVMRGGVGLIAIERQRQLTREGWSSEHDDDHVLGELSQAACAYASVASAQARGATADEFPADMMVAEGDWPWEESWWKPSPDPIRNLVFAGALIAAEIDRLQRAAKKET